MSTISTIIIRRGPAGPAGPAGPSGASTFADIGGVPADNAALDAALDAKVGTALEITTALQDLTLDPLQPTKIGADKLPNNLNVATLTFADGTGYMFDDGSFTGGADGLLYRHNGVDNDGVPYAPRPRNTLVFSQTWTAARTGYSLDQFLGRGNVSASGDITVTCTSTKFAGSEVVTVTLALNDRPSQWIAKVVAALNLNANFSTHYLAYNCGAILQAQSKTSGADDLAMVFAAGSTGITAGTSAAGTVAYFEIGRFKLLPSEIVANTVFVLTGSVAVLTTGTTAAGVLLFGVSPANMAATSISAGSSGNCPKLIVTKTTGNSYNSLLRFTSLGKYATVTGGTKFQMDTAAVGTSRGCIETVIPTAGGVPETIKHIDWATASTLPAVQALSESGELVVFASMTLDTNTTSLQVFGELTLSKV